ncbi:hypothetical protein Asp14428_70960 [Actinoplanes sp. NBRC 14428]|nr:hypothetical protein Asp14428_70960 [Actinoplanes sp. NBRC 14428]
MLYRSAGLAADVAAFPAPAYLVMAGVFLVIALVFVRRAVQPIGPLLRAAVAVAVVFLAVGVALLLVTAAVLRGM